MPKAIGQRRTASLRPAATWSGNTCSNYSRPTGLPHCCGSQNRAPSFPDCAWPLDPSRLAPCRDFGLRTLDSGLLAVSCAKLNHSGLDIYGPTVNVRTGQKSPDFMCSFVDFRIVNKFLHCKCGVALHLATALDAPWGAPARQWRQHFRAILKQNWYFGVKLRMPRTFFLTLFVSCVFGAVGQRLSPPALNPTDYKSPSGRFVLNVDPTDRMGRGEGNYQVSSNGVVVWTGTKPFTLYEAGITDDGIIGGYAYS